MFYFITNGLNLAQIRGPNKKATIRFCLMVALLSPSTLDFVNRRFYQLYDLYIKDKPNQKLKSRN